MTVWLSLQPSSCLLKIPIRNIKDLDFISFSFHFSSNDSISLSALPIVDALAHLEGNHTFTKMQKRKQLEFCFCLYFSLSSSSFFLTHAQFQIYFYYIITYTTWACNQHVQYANFLIYIISLNLGNNWNTGLFNTIFHMRKLMIFPKLNCFQVVEPKN